jgi:hypothetical protein
MLTVESRGGPQQIIPFNTEPENIITIQSKYEFDSNCSKKPKSKNGKKREGERETHTHTQSLTDQMDPMKRNRKKKTLLYFIEFTREG